MRRYGFARKALRAGKGGRPSNLARSFFPTTRSQCRFCQLAERRRCVHADGGDLSDSVPALTPAPLSKPDLSCAMTFPKSLLALLGLLPCIGIE